MCSQGKDLRSEYLEDWLADFTRFDFTLSRAPQFTRNFYDFTSHPILCCSAPVRSISSSMR